MIVGYGVRAPNTVWSNRSTICLLHKCNLLAKSSSSPTWLGRRVGERERGGGGERGVRRERGGEERERGREREGGRERERQKTCKVRVQA